MYLYPVNSQMRVERSVLPVLYGILFLLLGNVFTAQAQSITSFSPTTVCQGDVVTITGTDFTGATAVKLGNQNAVNFRVVNATTITATVANLATSGTITVTTPTGTGTAPANLVINQAPIPGLADAGVGDPFTNCDGNATYELKVSNTSSNLTGNNNYQINWGDNTGLFTQANWSPGAQTAHTYTSQGYFNITITITPDNGCTKSAVYRFYNGQNPLASFTTTSSTTGLCAPAAVEFQIGNWFNNSPGTTYQVNFGDGTPNVTLTHPLNAANTTQLISHLYTTSSCPGAPDFTATLKAINGCFTTTYTLNQIIIRKKPIADFTTQPAPACLTAPYCFTNNTTSGFSGNSCIATTNYSWDFGDGTAVSSVVSPCHTYAAPGTYNVTLTASNSTCGGDSKTQAIVVLPTSATPTVAPIIYCKDESPVPLTASGTGLLWYTAATGGTGTSQAPTPVTNTVGSKTYYVSQTIANNCESPRVPVTVTVNPLPVAPAVTTPVQLCQNQTPAPLTATGTGLLWYTTGTGGTGSSTAPTPSTAATGSTTYYVSQTTNNCEGPRASVVVVVNALAVAPGVTPAITYCQNQPAIPLTATGSGLLWYTAATGGIGSSTAPTPSTATPGSTTYYVSQVTGCGEGPRASITVTVNPSPSATISYTPSLLCNVSNTATTPNPPVPVTQTGTPGGTYSTAPSGLTINVTTGEINPSGAAAGVYTVRYTIPGTGGCTDYTVTATVTVSGSPTASITYPPLCTNNAATGVTRTGTSGGNYTSATGLTIDASSGTVTPATSIPGTYTVTYTISPSAPCPGYVTTTNVTVTQAPSASISYSPASLCNVTNTPSTPNMPVAVTQTGTTGGTYSVSPATGLRVDAATGQIDPSGATAGTYTVSYTIPGSGGCANYSVTATVTVSSSPTATITYPAICTADALTSVTRTGTAGGTFTSTTGLTINASTGAVTPATSTPGTYTVTYTILASAPCPGYIATTSVTITQAPSASISYSPANLCNVANTIATPNPPVAVVQTGTTGGNYTVAPASGLPLDATTGTITPAGAAAGSYMVKYTVKGTGGCADYSATTVVVINSAPTAIISYPGSPYCGGTTTAQPVTFSGTAGGVFSSSTGLSINPATGAITPSSSTPGAYTVTYTIAASAPCPGFITTAGVVINESPVVTFPVSSQKICSGGTADYTPSSTVANSSYSWSVTGALPANVSGITSGTASGANAVISLSFKNTGNASQSLTIRVIPVNPTQSPCPGAPYDLTLIVHPVPPAPVTATANLCMGTPPAALVADPLPGNTIKWYDNNLAPLNAAPVISTAASARFTYYVSQLNSFLCESPKSEIVAIVHPTPKIVGSSFAHPTACGIPSGSISLNVLDLNDNAIPNIPVIVHYNKFQVPYTATASTDAGGKITLSLTAGSYTEIYVETTNGCTSQKIPDVFILKDPAPPAQPVAGYNPPLCSETPLILTALSPTSTQAGAIDYVWAGPAFGPLPDSVNNTVITFPSAPLSYAGTYVVYAIQNNCISLSAEFLVAIKQSPAKPVIFTRVPLCIGEDLVLQAYSSIPGNGSLNFLWKGPGTGFPVSASNAGISKVKLTDAGIYTVTVSSPQTGCSTSSDTLIQIGGYPVVKFAQDTITLPTGYKLSLLPVITNATDPGILPIKSYTWTPSKDLECNDVICSAPIATIKNNVCYTVKATNFAGCSGSDEICIKVFCQNSQVFIPNAFTPHGNVAENNKLIVRATGIAAVKSFRVFNRWGKIVFEKNNFPPNSATYGWDGMINGKPADTGVYVYTVDVICENGVPYTFKGNVTLL